MASRRALALGLFASLLVAPLSAAAQGPAEAPPASKEPPSEEALSDEARMALAREQYDAGKLHYTVGEFDEALERFAAAYKLRPAPLLLFNMGQCHRQLKEHERAAFFFEGYLQQAPDGADRAVVEELLAETRAAVEEKQRQRALDRERASREAAPAEVPEQAAPEPAPGSLAPPGAEPAPPAQPEAPPEQGWLWVAVGSTAAVVVAGSAVTAGFLLWPRGEALPERSLGAVDLR